MVTSQGSLIYSDRSGKASRDIVKVYKETRHFLLPKLYQHQQHQQHQQHHHLLSTSPRHLLPAKKTSKLLSQPQSIISTSKYAFHYCTPRYRSHSWTRSSNHSCSTSASKPQRCLHPKVHLCWFRMPIRHRREFH